MGESLCKAAMSGSCVHLVADAHNYQTLHTCLTQEFDQDVRAGFDLLQAAARSTRPWGKETTVTPGWVAWREVDF